MAKKQYGLGHTRLTVPGRPDLTNKTAVVMVGDKTLEEALEEGGVSDYSDLTNKPSINGVELSGNKTSSDLGVATSQQGAKADTAYQKPSSGIPESDLSSGVQQALQKHFKGWWPDLATLKAAHTATEGDSAYVKDTSPATTWSIYVYDSTASSDNYWADSGTDADTSNVQTFASGEEVNEISIDNDFVGGSDKIAGAEGVKVLNQEVNGIEDVEINFGNEVLEYGYLETSTTWASRSSVGHYMLSVTPGQRYTITAKTDKQAQYAVLKERPTYDYGAHNAPSTSPVYADGFTTYKNVSANTSETFTIPSDGVCLYIRYQGGLFPSSLTLDGQKGVIEKVEELEENIAEIQVGLLPFKVQELDIAFHRANCSAGAPENTVQAVFQCAMIGAKIVECDIKYTSDGIPVIMHDVSINRTMMNLDGTDIEDTVKVYENTYATLSANYVYKSPVEKWRTSICTLEQWLNAVTRFGMIPLFDQGVNSVSFAMIKSHVGDNFIFMGNISECLAMRQLSKECFVWLKNSSSDEDGIIEELKSIGGRCGYSSTTSADFTTTFTAKLSSNGFFWQMSVSSGIETSAIHRGCKSILTDGTWCGNNDLHNLLFAMATDCSNVTATVTNGEVVIAPSGSVTIPLLHNGRRNILANLYAKGKFSLKIGDATTENVTANDDYSVLMIGRNTQENSSSFVITNTGIGNAYIKEIFVFTE